VAFGPYALGVVERSTLSAFQPLAVVGTAWLTLVIGADYGFQGGRRVSGRGMVVGLVLAAATASAIACGVYAAGAYFGLLRGGDLRLIAAGAGLVGCETTRHAVRWVTGRYAADGPLTRFVADLSESDDLVPILGIAMIFPAIGAPDVAIRLPWQTWAAITLLLGVVLGGTAAALLRSEPRAGDGWGVIIGATLLCAGIAWRLGLAPQAATFALGISLSALSRHGNELRRMLIRTEQPVLLPTLVLAGAEVEIANPAELGTVVLIAVALRFGVRFLAAPIVSKLAGVERVAAAELSLGLLPSGGLSITVALAFGSRFPGFSGKAILVVAVALALVGEAVGPGALRRALSRVGEIVPPPAAPVEVSAEPVVGRREPTP
jgi:Kef-type K+ transport system membrane component KefB